MTNQASLRREFEEMFDLLEQAIDQSSLNEGSIKIRDLLVQARQSLDVDLGDPIEYRDAAVSAALSLDASYGARAPAIAKAIQEQCDNRAFHKLVSRSATRMKWLRESTNLTKGKA